jgi:glycosyltransferase involved in cell wall biosynthesis
MRIGLDAKRAFYNYTGLGNYSRDAIRILSHYYPTEEYFLYSPKEKKNNRLSFLQQRDNVFVRTPFSFLGNLFKKYWRTYDIVKDLQQDEIDVFHGLSHELPIGIEKTNIKSVVTIHDLIFIRYPYLFPYIDRKIYFEKFKSACNRSNKIIAISEQTKADIIKYFGTEKNKIDVVYQGCNKVFQSEIDEKTKTDICKKYNLPTQFLLNVSSITDRKNQLTILKALLHLPNQHLLIIGDGKKYKQLCQNFVANNNLSSRVTFLTDLNLSEMAALYQSAQIMIYPSIFEGFGIPILEALFSKIPVITSVDSCFAESGGKHSVYINPLKEIELVEAITKINSDSSFRNNMIIKGYQHAQNFTDSKVAANLYKTYKSL